MEKAPWRSRNISAESEIMYLLLHIRYIILTSISPFSQITAGEIEIVRVEVCKKLQTSLYCEVTNQKYNLISYRQTVDILVHIEVHS